MSSSKCAQIGYADVPIDVRRMVAHTVIEGTQSCYRAIARQLSVLYTVDREACSGVWRYAFERAFGAVPGAQDGEDKLCPHLLGVNTWREALQRTYKAMYAVPKNNAWMWEGIKSWSQREMDARLALLGTMPSGALADLLRARGASILRFNRGIIKSQELINTITQASGNDSAPPWRDALLLQALRLIDVDGANPAYADPTGHAYSALHRACMGTSTSPVNFLLGVGARMLINYDCSGRTPLMLANQPEIWEELLRQGAGVNHYAWARDQNNKPIKLHPLTLAARYNQPDKVKALLEAGADPHAAGGAAREEAKKHAAQNPQMVADIEQYMRNSAWQ